MPNSPRARPARKSASLLSELVEPARFGIALDPFVETDGLEFLESGAESRKLIGRQFGHRFFDVFEGRHGHEPRLAERESA